MELSLRSRFLLGLQREVSRLLSPLWIPGAIAVLELGFGYHIHDLERHRRAFQRIRGDAPGPLVICPNHLTMIDSAIVAWALGSAGWYLRNFSAIPWNLPERRNFAYSALSELLSYVMKCLPITRGGDRAEVAETLNRFTHLVSRGDVGLVFPEGGRSRSGRVDLDSAAPGVGRIVTALPDCRVVCVYLRGARQRTFSDVPVRGERFRMRLSVIEPRTDSPGLRGSREVARQIVAELARLEEEHFGDRKRRRRSRGRGNRSVRYASAL
jgi:1-acyl-sn-glycerol-3-phosphate acyltransferase